MIILIVFGFLLSYVFMSTELINIEFAKAGVNDVLPEWQSYDDAQFYIKLQYWIGYIIMFFGVAQFIYTAVRKEEIEYNYM